MLRVFRRQFVFVSTQTYRNIKVQNILAVIYCFDLGHLVSVYSFAHKYQFFNYELCIHQRLRGQIKMIIYKSMLMYMYLLPRDGKNKKNYFHW